MGLELSKVEGRVTKPTRKSGGDIQPIVQNIRILLLGAGFSGKSTAFYQIYKIYHRDKIFSDKKYREVLLAKIRFNCLSVAVLAIHSTLQMHPNLKSNLDIQNILKFYDDHPSHISLVPDSKDGKEVDLNDVISSIITFYSMSQVREVLKILSQHRDYYDGVDHYTNIDNLARIKCKDYVPQDADVLSARTKTTGIIKKTIDIESTAYELIDVGGQRNERKKWKNLFSTAQIIVYIISLSDYDEELLERDGLNRMKEALETFESTCNGEYFATIETLVVFNKQDSLIGKFKKSGDTLSKYFPEYKGGDDPDLAIEFIKNMFLSQLKGQMDRFHVLTGSVLQESLLKECFRAIQTSTMTLLGGNILSPNAMIRQHTGQ